MVAVILKEASVKILFTSQKGNYIGTGHKELKIAFNKNIWSDDGLGEINIFLDGHSPGI